MYKGLRLYLQFKILSLYSSKNIKAQMYESYSMKIGSNIPWFIPRLAHQGQPDGLTGWNIGVYMRIGLWNFLRESYLTSKVTLSAIGNIEYALTQTNNVHCAINFCHKNNGITRTLSQITLGQGYSLAIEPVATVQLVIKI